MGRLKVASLSALILFAVSTPLFAQQGTAQIVGKITDEQGALPAGRRRCRHQPRDRSVQRGHDQRRRDLCRGADRAWHLQGGGQAHRFQDHGTQRI